jgi:glycosyltransferase involved in cell wall biosynthesis
MTLKNQANLVNSPCPPTRLDSCPDVLLVIRSCAEHYPPTVNQANLLAEAGLRVGLIDLTFDGTPEALAGSIRRHRVHRMWNSKLEAPYALWKRWVNWLRFHRACQAVIRQGRPRVVIAYDTLGSLFVPPTPGRYRTVYHFHELTGPEAGEGFGPRRARLKAARSSQHVDLVVFPDADRARIFQMRAGLRLPPRVVMNCPRRMATVPASPLRQRIAEFGPSAGAIVCYLGSIGADQGLPEAARSMRHWPSNSIFVLVGGASESMRKRILEAAASVGTADRVLFLGLHAHAEALALAAGADLGLSLIQPNNESWLYSAGAINKRFEYMALGLPQVTNNGPGVPEIIEANQCGLCVDSRDPAAIGAAVGQLLDSPELRRRMSLNARARHLESFNYENQFANVGEWIRKECLKPFPR